MKIISVLCLLIISSQVLACEVSDDIVATLKSCIDGITVKKTKPAFPDDKREYYELQFPQWIDHNDHALGKFSQKLILAHRNYDEPMVLQTSGYSIFQNAPSLTTIFFDTNQIQVEHRFFRTSTPQGSDWAKLNIKQSADDFHAIVVAFKQIYKQRWVNTGASKGGMTSIYHRRFYPADLDGTIADVAPINFSMPPLT